ncbi:MAG: arylsulfatase [Verrucomicrobiales bacterium]|nr:arylsulfatase [Verrucomicrobiales bacterium]
MRIFTTLVFSLAIVFPATLSAALPNVVIILVDDMGYGDAQCYNPDSKIPTPNIDRLAADGMRFTDAHAAGPLCHVSRYGLMTGRFPFRKPIQWQNNAVIDEQRMTIASLLQKSNYQTAMVGKWHLGFFEDEAFAGPLRGGPADRGFDSYFGIRASTDIPPYFYIRGTGAVTPPTETIEASQTEGWSPIQGKFWRAGGIAPDLKLEEVMPRFTTEAVSVIENHAKKETEKPLMLYLAYPAPHTPWLPDDEFVGNTGAGLYGDFVYMVDHQIGKIMASIEKAGMNEDTLVIFSSDNGPVWYPQDTEKFGHDSLGGLRGMKGGAWEGGHRMPFIVKWPGVVEAGTETDHLVSFTDVFATLAELTGTEIQQGQAPDSESFLPVLKGETADPRSPVVLQAGRKHFMIRSGDWKLITGPESGGFSKRDRKATADLPPVQLYNLREDIGETTNLYQKHPEKVKELTAKLNEIRG